MVTGLWAKDGRPWAEWGKQRKPMSKHQLANLLRPYNIFPVDVWVNGQCKSGYERSTFEPVWERYLLSPQQTPRPREPASVLDKTQFSDSETVH